MVQLKTINIIITDLLTNKNVATLLKYALRIILLFLNIDIELTCIFPQIKCDIFVILNNLCLLIQQIKKKEFSIGLSLIGLGHIDYLFSRDCSVIHSVSARR